MTNAQLQKLLDKNGITLRGTRAAKGVAPKAKGYTKSPMTQRLEQILPIGEEAELVNRSNGGIIEGLGNSNNNNNNNDNNNDNNNNNGMPPPNAPALDWIDVGPPVDPEDPGFPVLPYRPIEHGMGMGGYRRTRRPKRKSSMKKRK